MPVRPAPGASEAFHAYSHLLPAGTRESGPPFSSISTAQKPPFRAFVANPVGNFCRKSAEIDKVSDEVCDKGPQPSVFETSTFSTARMSSSTLVPGVLRHWSGALFRQRADGHFEWLSPKVEEWS